MNLTEIYFPSVPAFLGDTLQTKPLLRLMDVGMNCGCEYTQLPQFCGLSSYSRFEHSLGVALIVWKFTQVPAQAMAGLLHDISTPVFAHVVDFLKGDYLKQEATEADTERFILSSPDLLCTLEQHGLSLSSVKDYHIYPIADNDSPKLSADRLEYSLGNMVNYGFTDIAAARELYDDLCVDTNEFGEPELMFQHQNCAAAFAQNALRCAKVYVSDEDRYSMQYLAELLRDALSLHIISASDLNGTETQMIRKLLLNESTAHRWNNFRQLSIIEFSLEQPVGTEWRQIYAKKRYIDPYVKDHGRLSALDPTFATDLELFRSQSQDYWIRGRKS